MLLKMAIGCIRLAIDSGNRVAIEGRAHGVENWDGRYRLFRKELRDFLVLDEVDRFWVWGR